MPELPEVENARRCLLRAELPGRTFTKTDIGWSKSVKIPDLEEFTMGLRGAVVQDVHRRGKYILLPLLDEESETRTLIIHLGMSGGLSVQPRSNPLHPLVRHTFSLDDGRELRFEDGRKFGKLWLASNPSEVLPPLSPEPLEGGLTPQLLAESLKGRNAPIKALLLEQSIVAGMGNLYADESLFLAEINPTRSASGLTSKETERLQRSIVSALTASIDKYEIAREESWPDPPRALTGWSHPRAEGAPCPRCGGPFTGTRVRARGTYYCPKCQGKVRIH